MTSAASAEPIGSIFDSAQRQKAFDRTTLNRSYTAIVEDSSKKIEDRADLLQETIRHDADPGSAVDATLALALLSQQAGDMGRTTQVWRDLADRCKIVIVAPHCVVANRAITLFGIASALSAFDYQAAAYLCAHVETASHINLNVEERLIFLSMCRPMFANLGALHFAWARQQLGTIRSQLAGQPLIHAEDVQINYATTLSEYPTYGRESDELVVLAEHTSPRTAIKAWYLRAQLESPVELRYEFYKRLLTEWSRANQIADADTVAQVAEASVFVTDHVLRDFELLVLSVRGDDGHIVQSVPPKLDTARRQVRVARTITGVWAAAMHAMLGAHLHHIERLGRHLVCVTPSCIRVMSELLAFTSQAQLECELAAQERDVSRTTWPQKWSLECGLDLVNAAQVRN